MGLSLGLSLSLVGGSGPSANPLAPAATVAPAITPTTGDVGTVFTLSNGTWTNAPTFTRQWYNASGAIPGATGTTYTAVAGDRAGSIYAVVTGTSGAFTGTAASNSVTIPAAVVTLGTLTFSGALVNGTPSSGTINGATAGSTITSPYAAALGLNSAARTYSFDGTLAAGSDPNGLVETLAGATNSPKGSAATVQPASATVNSINGFGSSSVAGTGASTTPKAFLNLVGAAVGATTIRNNGQGGTVFQASPGTSGGAALSANGFGRYVSQLLGANISDRYYMTWPNDVRYTGNPSEFNAAGYARDMKAMLNDLIAQGINPDSIYLGSPTWYDTSHYAIGSAGYTGSTDAINQTYVAATLAVAQEYGTRYADLYTAIRDGGGLSLFVASDVHWNDAGHQIGANVFLAATNANTLAKPTGIAAASTVAGRGDWTWNAVAGAVSYEIEVGEAVTNTYAAGSAAPTGNSAQITGLTGNMRARVRAVFSGGGKSAWSFAPTPIRISNGFAPFFADSFTDVDGTLLTAHTTDSGHNYVIGAAGTFNAEPVLEGGRLRGPGSTGIWRAVAAAPSADCEIEGTIDFLSIVTSENVGAVLRLAAASNTYYWFRYGHTQGGFELYKTVAGTSTKLGTTYADTFTSGSRNFLLRAIGTTISLFIDNMSTPKIAVTDSAITAAGFPGVRTVGAQPSAGTGRQITNLVARQAA